MVFKASNFSILPIKVKTCSLVLSFQSSYNLDKIILKLESIFFSFSAVSGNCACASSINSLAKTTVPKERALCSSKSLDFRAALSRMMSRLSTELT